MFDLSCTQSKGLDCRFVMHFYGIGTDDSGLWLLYETVTGFFVFVGSMVFLGSIDLIMGRSKIRIGNNDDVNPLSPLCAENIVSFFIHDKSSHLDR